MKPECSITMLGTGAAMVTRCFNTCFVVNTPRTRLLVDAGGGNGILVQLNRAGISLAGIHHLFVTHCHTDHIIGVVWIIRRVSAMIADGSFGGTLEIYCHNEAANALRTMCALMMPAKLFAPLDHGGINLNAVTHGQQLTLPDILLTCFDIGSTKTLQYGFQAQLPNGASLTCLGDEPCQPMSEPFARGADWLLSEAYCLEADADRFRPYEKHHSTVADAARLASRIGVKNLLLYHTEDATLDTRRKRYTAEAQRYYDGRVVVPDDLDTVDIG